MKLVYSKKTRGFTSNSTLAILALSVALSSSLQAGIAITGPGSYTQNFNSLPNSGASNSTTVWANDSTLPGWFAEGQADAGALTSIYLGPHTTSGGSTHFYSFGSPLTDADRAIGFVQTNTNGTNSYALGLLLENQSASTISFDTFSYTGEQYRYSGAAANTNTAWYKISSSAITSPYYGTDAVDAGWTALSSLDFTSPAYSTNNPDLLSSGTVTNGNLANYKTAISADISTISLAPGEFIMFRFFDLDHSGTDHALAYDDLSVNWTAVPEPSTYALFLGLFMGIALIVRRRIR